MTFKIDDYLERNCENSALKEHIVKVHDDLFNAYKVVESVRESRDLSAAPSDELIVAVFKELRKFEN